MSSEMLAMQVYLKSNPETLAQKMGYVHYWTANGNVLVRRSDESNPITIKNDLDLNLIK